MSEQITVFVNDHKNLPTRYSNFAKIPPTFGPHHKYSKFKIPHIFKKLEKPTRKTPRKIPREHPTRANTTVGCKSRLDTTNDVKIEPIFF